MLPARKVFKNLIIYVNMKIDLVFLGTSQAVPTAKRNHTSILLRYKDEMILVDCGEGTQRQFRIAGINPCRLTRILITHWHGDHVLGIPGLLQTLALNGYNRTLHVYGPKGTKRFMETIYDLFVFRDNKINIKIEEVNEGKFFENGDFILQSFPLNHSTYCNAYSFEEKEKRRIDALKIKKLGLKGEIIGRLQMGETIIFKGKKIKPDEASYMQKGKKISFIMDTAVCKNCIEVAKNADLLVSESTYSSELEEKARGYKHLTAKDAAEIAKKSKAKRLILTHISQRYEKDDQKILKDASKIFRETELAKDFMKISV